MTRKDDLTEGRYPRPFGKYVLLRSLARGGMGEIHLAAGGEIGGFEKVCVIKKVLPEKGDPGRTQRFLDEAKVVVRLGHANLVTVFDAGEVEDEFYIAMEYVEGKNLREVWNRCAARQTRFPIDIALYVVREVCRGLAYAHEYGQLGLVHRDVSPPNILLSYFGEVKLTDFGLARSVLKQEKTAPGIVYGRYAYLSPEQARGESADGRTDLYSMGIILWELLTGRQLFPVGNSDPATAISVVRNPRVQPPSTIATRISPSLDAVVMRSLAPRREDRYSNAEEMRRGIAEELAKIAPTTDAERVSTLLRELYEDVIDAERAERDRLVRVDLPRMREAQSGPVVTGGQTPTVPQSDVASREPAKPSELVGATIDGRYRILSILGEGGMGAVYEAEHVDIGKRFALKVLNPLYSRQADLVARFRREARAASTIGHPNIVDVSDFGTTAEGSFYYVMERLDGVELGQVLGSMGRIPSERSVVIVAQVCRALAAAHEANIVHRDLKPENIFLITRDGAADFVKVLDFGIAKALGTEESRRLTSPGMAIGTPEYMAPEQAAGKSADMRSDIYSIGAILYEMLTGAPPYDGENAMEVLSRKASQDPTPPRELHPEISEALEQVVMRALARNPADRPQSMAQLEYELVRSMEGRGQAVAAVLGLRRESLGLGGGGRPVGKEPSGAVRRGGVDDVLFELAVEQAEEGRAGGRVALASADAGGAATALEVSSQAVPSLTYRSEHSAQRLGWSPAGLAALGSAQRQAKPRVFTMWLGVGMGLLAGLGMAAWLLHPLRRWFPKSQAISGDVGLQSQSVAPAHVDPVAGELTAADDALRRQHWLAPKGQSVYDALKRLWALAPDDPRVVAMRQRIVDILDKKGEEASRAHRFGEAEVAYRSLAKIDPKVDRTKSLARAVAGQAGMALAAGRRDAAGRAAREALALDPMQPDARAVLARLERVERRKKARR